MKNWRVTADGKAKTVRARTAQSAANKAFPPGYSYRWDELDPNNAWAGVQGELKVSDGKTEITFQRWELG